MRAATSADFDACLRMARHYENFPVASRLLPRPWRRHLAAVYAFARGADDLADEPLPGWAAAPDVAARAARLEALDCWEAGLDGEPPADSAFVFRALSETRAECRLDDRWFRDLVEAFRWDAGGRTYASWDELRAYADRSAAPIGRLVLGVAGVRDARCETQSDELCVALQYTNFWQDLSVDWSRRRFYLPEEAWRAEGVDQSELRRRFDGRPVVPAELSPGERAAAARVVAEAVRRTEDLFQHSRALPRGVPRQLAPYLTAVWRGGARVLARVRHLGIEAFVRRPRLGAVDRLHLVAGAAAAWARSA